VNLNVNITEFLNADNILITKKYLRNMARIRIRMGLNLFATSVADPGCFIPNPVSDHCSIPDPEGKKAPDPGSATLAATKRLPNSTFSLSFSPLSMRRCSIVVLIVGSIVNKKKVSASTVMYLHPLGVTHTALVTLGF
jgi:hypothetical protein